MHCLWSWPQLPFQILNMTTDINPDHTPSPRPLPQSDTNTGPSPHHWSNPNFLLILINDLILPHLDTTFVPEAKFSFTLWSSGMPVVPSCYILAVMLLRCKQWCNAHIFTDNTCMYWVPNGAFKPVPNKCCLQSGSSWVIQGLNGHLNSDVSCKADRYAFIVTFFNSDFQTFKSLLAIYA